jgi:DNA modification methylase
MPAEHSTFHRLILGDAREMPYVPDQSVHLVVTSPPYWNLKRYNDTEGQLGHVADYEKFLGALEQVWRECFRALVPGGRLVCVVGDVCLSRRRIIRDSHLLRSDVNARHDKMVEFTRRAMSYERGTATAGHNGIPGRSRR